MCFSVSSARGLPPSSRQQRPAGRPVPIGKSQSAGVGVQRPAENTWATRHEHSPTNSIRVLDRATPVVSLHPPSANPETANHFFISVELTPPGKKAIKCLALFDSGSQTSLVSEAFVKIHRLPRLLLNKPICINSIDETPLANGAITHSISVCLSVGRHEEVRAFGIIPMRLDLIIGADWIEAHKPVASFDSQSLTLQCCNLSSAEKLYFERTSFATNPSSTFSNTVTQETASPNILSAHVDIYSDTAQSAEVASANPLLVICYERSGMY